MRRIILAALILLALVGSVATPAAAREGPGMLVTTHSHSPGTLLVWEPVVDAYHYAVYRGPSPDELVLVALVEQNAYLDQMNDSVQPSVYYAVTAVTGAGETDPTVVNVEHGSCVAMGSKFEVKVSLANCLPDWN